MSAGRGLGKGVSLAFLSSLLTGLVVVPLFLLPHPPLLSSIPRQLTFSSGSDIDPELSPDGRTVAYSSNATGRFEIWTIGVDGKHMARLTDLGLEARSPRWSPDGSILAFLLVRGNLTELWEVDKAGGSLRPLVITLSVSTFEWNPDGRKIVFDSRSSGSWRIYTVSTDKGVTALLFEGRYPSWSPDGGRIAYCETTEANYTIAIRAADGSGAKRLTDATYSSVRPAFTHDGSGLVFISNRFGSWALWTMEVDGSHLSVLGTFGMDVDPNLTPTLSVSQSRVTLGARAIGGSVGLLLFVLNDTLLNPDLPFRGVYDSPVGVYLGTAGISETAPSLSRDELTVVFSSLGQNGEHVWILTSKKPISPYSEQ